MIIIDATACNLLESLTISKEKLNLLHMLSYLRSMYSRLVSVRASQNKKIVSAILVALLCLSSCVTSSVSPKRSQEYLNSYREGLDLLERYRLRLAETSFKRCVMLDSLAFEGHWQLGRSYLLQGLIEKGSRALGNALRLKPDLHVARSLLLETVMGRGSESLELGDYSKATEYFKQAMKVDSTAYEPMYQSAVAAMWLKEDLMADSLFKEIIDKYPDKLQPRWQLQNLSKTMGKLLPGMSEKYRFPYKNIKKTSEVGIRFEEIGSDLGVDKMDGGRSSAWADFDGDGDLDLVAIGHPELAYYKNEVKHFVELSSKVGLNLPEGGIGAHVADYDNDGDPDLYITRDGWFGGGANVLFNNETGQFSDVTDYAGAGDLGSGFCAAWADYDKDGWLDIYIANGTGATGDSTNVLYKGSSEGRFIDVAFSAGVDHRGQSLSATWGDFDADSNADLYVCNFTEPNVLYRNKGDGSFEDVSILAGVAASHIDGFITFPLDYNNDGALDIFVGNWSSFEEVLEDRALNHRAGDRERPVLFKNNGNGVFIDVTESAGIARAEGTMSGAAADVDNDGWTDLYLGNGGPKMERRDPDVLYRNMSDGTFSDITDFVGLGHVGKSHGVTFADYDADGDSDLYVPSGGALSGDFWHNVLYRNEGSDGGFFVLRLEGRRSNRDGIGARVRLQCNSLVQTRFVESGNSFGNSNSLELEFGLGDCENIAHVEIQWPSGQVDRFWEPPVNSWRIAVEGEEHLRKAIR
ncbi:MAG: FG-GAP-like repeat-containing protein [Candidatus Latescibacterota bacterium]|nr:FG-GAP-like repeat-containing protein [Candidatus Latescibacterota bacterium]